MVIQVESFGDILISRPAGRESFMGAVAYIFNKLNNDEQIILDFSNVKVLAPSWADEFIINIKKKYQNKIVFINTENPSVSATLKTIFSVS